MSGNKIFVDTNILLYLLKGDTTLEAFLQDKNIYVSFITEMELLGFAKMSEKEYQQITSLLAQCTIIDMDAGIKQMAIPYQKQYRLKLPDSLIVATASYLSIPFITADTALQRLENILGMVIYKP